MSRSIDYNKFLNTTFDNYYIEKIIGYENNHMLPEDFLKIINK